MDGETRAELDRVHDEDKRQNHRLDDLETKMLAVEQMNISMHELAINTNNIAQEMKKQGDRLEKLEKKPGESWNNVQNMVLSAVVSALCGGGVVVIGALIVFAVQHLI